MIYESVNSMELFSTIDQLAYTSLFSNVENFLDISLVCSFCGLYKTLAKFALNEFLVSKVSNSHSCHKTHSSPQCPNPI